jgi:hypothetical protein
VLASVLSGSHSERLTESPAEMSRVGETPSGADRAHRPVMERRITQVPKAMLEPAPPDPLRNRTVLGLEQLVQVPQRNVVCAGDGAGREFGVTEMVLDEGIDALP